MLLIRPYVEEDRADFRRLATDPKVMEKVGGALTPAKADALFDRFLRNEFLGAFAVLTEELVGHVALMMPEKSNTPEISVLIDPRHWGKGYATSALRTVIENAFKMLPIDAIRGTVDTDHKASIRVMEKAGMSLEREAKDARGTFLVYSVERP